MLFVLPSRRIQNQLLGFRLLRTECRLFSCIKQDGAILWIIEAVIAVALVVVHHMLGLRELLGQFKANGK